MGVVNERNGEDFTVRFSQKNSDQSLYSKSLRLCPTLSAVTVLYSMWKWQNDCLNKDWRD